MSVWKRLTLGLTIGISIVPGVIAPAPAGAAEPVDPGRLDAHVREQMERTGVPGVAYAVVGPDGVEHAATFGETGDGADVTPQTAFLWGSVAKPVSATLAVLLADHGVLDLDAPVASLLPRFAPDDERADTITVRRLLDQTSGLPQRLDLTDRFDADRRPVDVVEQLDDVPLAADPGSEHVYSSLNYVVLAAVVEEVTGRAFGDVLRERLLAPAGMDDALTDAADAAERLPRGHRYVVGTTQAMTTDYDPAGVAYGYLGGTLDDLVAFARAYLSGPSDGGVLTGAERDLLTTPVVDSGGDQRYALGWRSETVPGTDEPMTWHSGAAPGYATSVVLLPEQDRAVVVLQNAYGPFQEAELLDTGFGLASILSGAEPETHGVDPLYWVVLGALTLVGAALLVVVGVAAWRLARPRPRRPWGRAALGLLAWVVPLVLVLAVALRLPSLLGVAGDQVELWAPDVAALLEVVLVGAGLALVARLAVTVRTQGQRNSVSASASAGTSASVSADPSDTSSDSPSDSPSASSSGATSSTTPSL